MNQSICELLQVVQW